MRLQAADEAAAGASVIRLVPHVDRGSSQGDTDLERSHLVTFLTGWGGRGGGHMMLGRVIQCHLPSSWSRCF